MLITKFNRMIRNRWVWAFVGGIVVLSFIIAYLPSSNSRSGPTTASITVGKLNGKPVSQEEFRDAKLNVYLGLGIQIGHRPPPGYEAEMRNEAWRRIVTVRTARELGITVSDREVAMAIERDPMFQTEGAFSQSRYEAFIKAFLEKDLAVTDRQFEEYVREQLVLQKMRNLVAPAVWIPPAEFQEMLRKYTDAFTVDYFVLKAKDVAKDVKVTPDEAKAAYEANTNLFIIPEKVSVKYVVFPLSRYATNMAINASDITNYYGEHIEEFTIRDTNDTTIAEDVDDVRDMIEETLVHETTLAHASDQAAMFVDKLTPGRSGTAPSFENVAADMRIAVSTTTLFSAKEKLKGFDVGLDFNRAAFSLRPNSDEYFSDPIAGADAIYVLAFNSREDARLPNFEDVKDKATALAIRKAERETVARKGQEIHDFIQKAMSGGKSFAEAAKAQGVTLIKPESFTAYDPPAGLDSERVLSGIIALEKGELSESIPTEEGALIAYVADRKTGDQASIESIRNQLMVNLNRRRGRAVFTEWQQSLLDKSKLEDLEAITNSEASAEE